MRVDKLSALCATLGGEHERELRRLLDFYDAHREALPFAEGDHIALTGEAAGIDYRKAPGWSSNAGMLRPGNTGIIRHIAWNGFSKCWQYSVEFDVEWSVSSLSTDTRIYVTTQRKHTFMLPGRFLRLATNEDEPILPPRGATAYMIDGRRDATFDEVHTIAEATS